MTKVSIIIPNYNGEKYLKDCMEAIWQQQDISYEVIIIDNASTDSTYEWLRQAGRVRFKQLDRNYGFSPAVNEGIRLAQGEYVLLLNNDTVILADFLVELVKAIEENANIFAVSSKMIAYHDPQVMDDAGDEYSLLGWTLKRGDGKKVTAYDKSCKVFSACAGAALYRKSILDEVGYFDERFFAYMEDVDLSYRARIYGYYNTYCAKAQVYHVGSATSGSRYNALKVRLAARNNIYVPYKNMPLLQLLINLPFLTMGYIIKYLFFMKKGFGKVYLEGLLEGMKTLDKVEKVPFKWSHLKYYIHIEGLLIKNTVCLLIDKLQVFKVSISTENWFKY